MAGVRYLAPIDPQGGGSWITVNEWGVAVALLNRYDVPVDQSKKYESRGRLVVGMAGHRSAAEVADAVPEAGLDRFPPFVLLTLDRHGPAHIVDWDGQTARRGDASNARMPLVSSGYRQLEVEEHRRRLLAAMTPLTPDEGGEWLWRFHCAGEDGPDSYSPHMSHPLAWTVSFSWVTVTQDEVVFRYLPEPPRSSVRDEMMVLRMRAGYE